MSKNYVVTFFSTTILLVLVTLAYAETIQIGVSSSDEEYINTIIPSLSKHLENYGYTAAAGISADNQESIEKVRSGKLPAALIRFDVAALNMKEVSKVSKPKSNLILLGKLVPEALFCAAKKGGQVTSYEDLTAQQKPRFKVSVGEKGNQSAAKTLQYLMKLDTQLNSIEIVQEEGNLKIQMNRLISGEVDLVCLVMMPDIENEFLQTVVKHKELMFINFDKKVFTQAEANGNLGYDLMEIPVNKNFFGFKAKRVNTLVTWVGLVVNAQLVEPKLLAALSKVVLKDDLLRKNSLASKAIDLFKTFQVKVTH